MFGSMEAWLRFLIVGLSSQFRWSTFYQEKQESVLEHSYKMAVLMQVMLGYEMLHGNRHNLRMFELLACAINHDWGEILMGDIPLPNKTEESEELEDMAYETIFELGIPEALRYQSHFQPPYNRRKHADRTHVEFWHAVEQVGYVVYAIEEVAQGDTAFQVVIDGHKDSLQKYAKKFYGVKVFCDQIY